MARYHNVYGPFGTYDDGREKAPAALGVERLSTLRDALTWKAIEAKLSGSCDIVIWEDGTHPKALLRYAQGADPVVHVDRRLREGNAEDHALFCYRPH